MRFEIREMPVRLTLLVVLVLVSGVASFGQALDNLEITGHLGLVSGIGHHGSFGGSIGAPVTDRFLLSGDFSYIPFGGGSVTTFGGTTSTGARAYNFNGNLQYQFNKAHGVVPYAGGGLGFLRSSFNVTSTTIPSLSTSGSATDLYFNMGGGMRYYVNDRWGFRPEFMVFAGPNTYVRLAGGLFYKFGE